MGQDSTEEAREKAGTYLTSLDALPVAMLVAEREANPVLLFYAGMAIESIVETFHDDLTAETTETLVTILVTRLNSEITVLEGRCMQKFVSCLAVIAANSIEYIDRWPQFGLAVCLPFFARLFEYRDKKEYNINEPLSNRLAILAQTAALNVLRETHEMSPDWIIVAIEMLRRQERDDFQILHEFLGRLETVPSNPALFPAFYDLFTVLVNDFGDCECMSSSDRDFVEQVMQIMFVIADQLHEHQLQMAMFIYQEIFDFSPEFFLEPGRRTFALKAMNAFIQRIPELATEVDDFMDLMGTMSGFMENVVPYAPRDIWELIIAFTDTLIGLITENYEEFAKPRMAGVFTSLVVGNVECAPKPLLEYYSSKLENPTSGVIFAVSSSVSDCISPFVPRLCDLLFTGNVPPEVALYFIKRQRKNAGESLGRMLEYLYNEMAKDFNQATAQALLAITATYPEIFIRKHAELLVPIVGMCESTSPEGFVYLMRAILNIIPAAANVKQTQQLGGVIMQNLERVVGLFVSQEDAGGLFEFLDHIVSHGVSEELERFYSLIFEKISELIGPLWTMQNEAVMKSLCEFLERCVELKIAKNLMKIIEWVSNAICVFPVPEHFNLLERIAATEDHYRLFSEQRQIMGFIVKASEEGHLSLECVRLVSALVQRQWKEFFFYFSPQFVFNMIKSDDVNIVEQGLSILFCIKLTDEMRPFLEAMVHVIIEGMFTNFVGSCVKTAVEILVAIVNAQICSPEDMAKLVLSNIPFENKDANNFAKVFTGQGNAHLIPYYAQRMVDSCKRQRAQMGQ